MFSILQYRIIMSFVLILFLAAVVLLLILCRFYNILITETENMAATDEKILYQCKKKFSTCYRLHNGVLNVPVFVDKYLRKIKMGKFTVTVWKHLSGQFMLASVFVSGCGACVGIMDGKTLGEILPFYIISMLELYLYFVVSGWVDIEEKKRALKINLVDYLENHMGNKLEDLKDSVKRLNEVENGFCEQEKTGFQEAGMRSMKERAELEQLLREFLA